MNCAREVEYSFNLSNYAKDLFFDLTEYESPKQHIPHFLFFELPSFDGSN
jgi:hypothetical protein